MPIQHARAASIPPDTESARTLKMRSIPERVQRSRAQSMKLRRALHTWLRDTLTMSQKIAWCAAMGRGWADFRRRQDPSHCEQAPWHPDDLLLLPTAVRELLWIVMEQWATAIDRGEM